MQKKWINSLFLILLLSGCTSVHKRDEAKEPIPGPNMSHPVVQPPSGPVQPEMEPELARPKIGVILSPGGLKTFAQIGVLRELENQRIPIDMIGGMEWGSLVAGLYATKGKANDAEWKLSKLPKELMPKKEFIGRDWQSSSMTDYEPFLDNIFEGKTISQGTVPFVCPARSLQKNSTTLFQRNNYSDAIMLCLPFPPATKAYQNWVAAPFDIKLIADEMKQQGIQYIILINVVPGGQRLADSSESNKILWSQIVQEMKFFFV